MTSINKDILYDVPVSNHGARVRIILKEKQIESLVDIKSPQDLGGMKSPAYLALNMHGKIPLLMTGNGQPIPESDTIARYILDAYPQSPSFMPNDLPVRYLSEQITRWHDIYISPIQGCMYKAPGTSFSIFGKDRRAALDELLRQLHGIEQTITKFYELYPQYHQGDFLCGDKISLADATLFPTMVFFNFMLPKFFGDKVKEDFMSCKVLNKWFEFMSSSVASTMAVRKDIEKALQEWESNGRFLPIMEEMK